MRERNANRIEWNSREASEKAAKWESASLRMSCRVMFMGELHRACYPHEDVTEAIELEWWQGPPGSTTKRGQPKMGVPLTVSTSTAPAALWVAIYGSVNSVAGMQRR